MIKLKHIISEKKELGGALINKIDDLTDKNAHNMARLTLAKAMRNKILMKFDKASTYRPLDEDSARNIVSSILDSLIEDSDRGEDITNEE